MNEIMPSRAPAVSSASLLRRRQYLPEEDVIAWLLARANPRFEKLGMILTWGYLSFTASTLPSREPLSTTMTSKVRPPECRKMDTRQLRRGPRVFQFTMMMERSMVKFIID
jgi:hypothetical protein